MPKSNIEVIQLKSGTFVCRDKVALDGKRRKTYLKGEKKPCISQMRRLILANARKNRVKKPKKEICVDITNQKDAKKAKKPKKTE